MLEHHSHLLPMEINVGAFGGDVRAFKEHPAPCGDFQQVQAPKEGGFAGAGGTDNHYYFSPVNGGGYAVQGFDSAPVKMFLQVFCLDDIISAHCFSASFPACPPGR